MAVSPPPSISFAPRLRLYDAVPRGGRERQRLLDDKTCPRCSTPRKRAMVRTHAASSPLPGRPCAPCPQAASSPLPGDMRRMTRRWRPASLESTRKPELLAPVCYRPRWLEKALG